MYILNFTSLHKQIKLTNSKKCLFLLYTQGKKTRQMFAESVGR